MPRVCCRTGDPPDATAARRSSMVKLVALIAIFLLCAAFYLGTTIHADAGASTPNSDDRQIPWGDVWCDETVDALDGLTILKHVASFPSLLKCGEFLGPLVGDHISLGPTQALWGDTDCDGDIDAVDALWLLKFVAGFEITQAPGCPEFGELIDF